MYTIEDFVDISKKVGVSFVGCTQDTLHEFMLKLDEYNVHWYDGIKKPSETNYIVLSNAIWHGLVMYNVSGRVCLQGGNIEFWEEQGYTMVPCIEFLKGNKPNFDILEYNSLIEN
jgi:hypothetical protein